MRAITSSAIVCILVAFLPGCHHESTLDAQDPTKARETAEAHDPQTSAPLKQEIVSVRQEIEKGEAETQRYSGGLVKALIESRVATQKQTLAMLEQRDKAWTFGMRLKYTVDGKPFALPPGTAEQLPQVERELRDLSAQIEGQELEVSKYSGGLVQALSLSTLETMRQTQAMLNQRRLAITFQLPQYLAFQNTGEPATAVPTMQPAAATTAPSSTNDSWEIVEIASRPGESNDVWTRFAWKLTIRNKGAYTQKFDATIEFRDADGFPVDHDSSSGLVVPAGSQETFTGEKLITANQVAKVSGTAAKVRPAS